MDNNSTIKKIVIEKQYENKKKQIDTNLLNESDQLIYINKLFLNENICDACIYIKKEITKKLNSYIYQDKQKNIYDNTSGLTFDDIIIKLMESKLKCTYCKKNVLIIYDKKLQQNQWTLDRTNNYEGHNNDNTVICCLNCNIKRGRINNKKFLFTKQLVIKKKDD
mgnify:FL=1